MVAIPFQVFTITGSSLAVGMIGLATIVPLVTLSLAGGAIADAVDRRKLLLVTQLLSAATSAGLALNAGSSSPRLWPIYVLAALSAGLAGVDLPARNAIIPRLVGRELYPSAAALGQIQFQVGQVAGPALAGADHQPGQPGRRLLDRRGQLRRRRGRPPPDRPAAAGGGRDPGQPVVGRPKGCAT